jgi:hypothetical protein
MKTNASFIEVKIYNDNVGYNPKIGSYATLMSDINELSAIVPKHLYVSMHFTREDD